MKPLDIFNTVKQLGDEPIINMGRLKELHPDKFEESGQMNWKWFESEIRPRFFVYVRPDVQSISFTIQNGPIKEVGKNGCQVDHLIEAAKLILESFNKEFPCRENSSAITKLDEALMWLDKRRKDRVRRGVEGRSEV